MNIAQTELDDLRIELAVTVTPEDYNPRVETVLKRQQKQATMPGFRKGRCRCELIRRQYGQSVLADELNRLLERGPPKPRSGQTKLNILGSPISREKPEVLGGLERAGRVSRFHYEVGLSQALVGLRQR